LAAISILPSDFSTDEAPRDASPVRNCGKCNTPRYRLEDESRFRLPLLAETRMRKILSQPTQYLKVHAAATSGFYDYHGLSRIFPESSHHERCVAESHWKDCHPYVCDCHFGPPAGTFCLSHDTTDVSGCVPTCEWVRF
jgi:hypothetical protein